MPNKLEQPPDVKQKRIVARLAAQCHVPVAEMATLYEKEHAKLAKGARVTKFLDVFATRHVLEALQPGAEATPVPIPDAPEPTDV